KFKTYAEHRIRGSILDELRKWDSVSRSMRDKEKQLTAVRQELVKKLGRDPTSREVASALDMTLEEYHDYRFRADAPWVSVEFDDQLAHIEGLIVTHGLPYESLNAQQTRQMITDAIERLPER